MQEVKISTAEQLHDRNAFAQARWQARSLDDHWMLKVQAKMNWASSAYQDTLVANRRNDATYWQREYYTSAALMWMPDDGWALDYSADWMMNSLNSTLATDLRPHRHGILQSLSARYAKGRWVESDMAFCSRTPPDMRREDGWLLPGCWLRFTSTAWGAR